MGTFEIVRTVRASPERVFSVVGDLAAYGEFLPMTSIETDAGTIAPGWHFTARTGPAPVRLVDRMRVSEWDPPRGFRVVKLGPVLDGWAQVHLTGEGADTRVVWRERIVVRPVRIGGPLSRIYDPVNTWLFGRALDRMTLKVRGE
ncbi:MAG: SRPBCC family protein [Actinomycetota bacterium]|jgi:carbon monoxide dehydrogenase subunit G|nr:SRPBCC family protein [Actinomycetota bacterium]MDQ3527811.1 SRPBCC family protein [Actinomycetota bacterium]